MEEKLQAPPVSETVNIVQGGQRQPGLGEGAHQILEACSLEAVFRDEL